MAYDGNLIPKAFDGLAIWLDASDVSTLSFRSGSDVFIDELLDKSHNSFDLIQTSEINQPEYLKNAINGLNAIEFKDPYFLFKISYNRTDLSANLQEAVLFTVIKPTQKSALSRLVAEAEPLWMYIEQGGSFLGSMGNTSTDRITYSYPGGFFGTTHVLTMYRTGNNLTLRVDGSQVSTIVRTGSASPGTSFFGLGQADPGTSYLGLFGEMTIFNRAMSLTDITLIENALMTKWGIS